MVAGESSNKMNPFQTQTVPSGSLFECHSIQGSKIMNHLLSSCHNPEIYTVSLSVLQEVRMTVGLIIYFQILICNYTDNMGVSSCHLSLTMDVAQWPTEALPHFMGQDYLHLLIPKVYCQYNKGRSWYLCFLVMLRDWAFSKYRVIRKEWCGFQHYLNDNQNS